MTLVISAGIARFLTAEKKKKKKKKEQTASVQHFNTSANKTLKCKLFRPHLIIFSTTPLNLRACYLHSRGFRPDNGETQACSGDDRFVEGGEGDRIRERGVGGGAREGNVTAGYNCHLLQVRLQQQEEGKKG